MTSILVTSQAAGLLRARLSKMPGGDEVRLVTFGQADDHGLSQIRMALVSRDITGTSTKYVHSEALARFYDVLRAADRLQWVHTHSAGLDRPIFGELQARGVTVTASSGANAQVVAHTAVGAVLALARRFPLMMRRQARHEWHSLAVDDMPPDLPGQTAAIVGWGPIGQGIGALLSALGVRIVVARHSGVPVAQAAATTTYADMASILREAHWLIIACPLAPATNRLVDAPMLAALPAGAHVVNIGRGEILVERDLIAALDGGHLAGAFLDVFEQEPLPANSPLWDREDVMITPHSAGHAAGNYQRVLDIFLEKLAHRLQREQEEAGRSRSA